jgi:hypothetical protein
MLKAEFFEGQCEITQFPIDESNVVHASAEFGIVGRI